MEAGAAFGEFIQWMGSRLDIDKQRNIEGQVGPRRNDGLECSEQTVE